MPHPRYFCRVLGTDFYFSTGVAPFWSSREYEICERCRRCLSGLPPFGPLAHRVVQDLSEGEHGTIEDKNNTIEKIFRSEMAAMNFTTCAPSPCESYDHDEIACKEANADGCIPVPCSKQRQNSYNHPTGAFFTHIV